ncbi:hypothetical protein IW138_000269 [Coemansia sp. RSA 986]|nr:hypothetical protein IW138_000269 [Coemansia sp. RSA 986]
MDTVNRNLIQLNQNLESAISLSANFGRISSLWSEFGMIINPPAEENDAGTQHSECEEEYNEHDARDDEADGQGVVADPEDGNASESDTVMDEDLFMELRNRKVSEEDTVISSPTYQPNEQTNDSEQSIPVENSTSIPNEAEESLKTRDDTDIVNSEAENKVITEPLLVNSDANKDNNNSDDDDEHMADEDLGSVSGGFLGDFEEIDEDEDVERFISLNHTPLPSARQSPAPLFLPQKTGSGAVQRDAEPIDVEVNDSGDESDGSFESIPERATRATTELDTADALMTTETVEPSVSETDAAVTMEGEEPTVQTPRSTKYNGVGTEMNSTNAGNSNLDKLRILQEKFRERVVPKLADGVFFSLDVYKRYTVVAVSDKLLNGGTSNGSGSTDTANRPTPTTQKPSSLRRNIGNNVSTAATATQNPTEKQSSAIQSAVTSDSEKPGPKNHDIADNINYMDAISANVSSTAQPQSPLERQPVSRPRSPLAVAQKAKRVHTNADDDVVGTLLGVMKSPKIASSIQPQQDQAQQTKTTTSLQQKIPNDMLAAMMAIEGPSALETPKTPIPRAPNQQISAKEFAAKLPSGYKGPFSQMSTAEHAHFLGLVQKVRAGQLGTKESTEYQRFKAKIDTEQQKFRTQAREKSLPLLKYISESASQTTRKRLSELSDSALKHYAHRYTSVRVAAIRSSVSGYMPLVYKETLLQRGKCYRVQIPNLEGSSTEGNVSTTVDPWNCMQSDGKLVRNVGIPVTSDPVALKLARLAQADVVVSASSLIALLTLPQSYMRDVAIPFKVMNLPTDPGKPERSILIVDKPLMSAHASTPRKLNQMFYETCAGNSLTDRSQQLELGGGTTAKNIDDSDSADQLSSDNANYTLWEFGGLRIIVRYGVHGFHALENAKNKEHEGAEWEKTPTTTVTLKTKLEYHLENSSAEVAVASCGGTERSGGAYEDITESERLSWWMSSYLRGSSSEVWVSHVNVQRSAVACVTKHTCAELYPGTVHVEPGTGNGTATGSGASIGGPQPSTRGLLALLQDLQQQTVGDYMLVHKRRTWDATIYRALEKQPDDVSPATTPRANSAIMNLEEELETPSVTDLTQLDIEGDYVPVVWRGLACQIPYTYAPADLAEFCASASTWNSGGASGSGNQSARSRRRAANKRKKVKKASHN